MTTKEILHNLLDNGGFHNHHKWNWKQCMQYVKAQYNCSNFIAKKVALQIRNW